MVEDIIASLNEACENLVQLITFGQVSAIREMYQSWLSSAPLHEPTVLGYLFAGFIVVVRFAVPVVLFYYLFVRVVFKNVYLRIVLVTGFAVIYALFYFNPIIIFEQASVSVTNFYYFLKDLPHLSYAPVLFTFLTNGAVIFVLRAIAVFLTLWIFFMLLIGLGTMVLWIVTGGKSVWSYTEKNFKAFTLQLTIAFLMFYPFIGAFRTFMTILALIIGAVNFRDAIYTIRGYQKVCYNTPDGQIQCRWAR